MSGEILEELPTHYQNDNYTMIYKKSEVDKLDVSINEKINENDLEEKKVNAPQNHTGKICV